MKVQKWWHRPRPVGFLNYGHQPGMTSEYIDEYFKRNIVATESCKPAYDMRKSDAKISGKTTFRRDYIPHPLPEKKVITREVYKPPGTAMEGVSMYRQDYPLVKGDRPQLAKRSEARKLPSGKFDTVPTYTSEYKRWNIEPRASFRADREYKVPAEKMENTSTFRRDYIAHSAAPRESAKPPNVAFQSDQPLQSATIHKINFVPHRLEPRPPREAREYVPPAVAMDSSTTFRQSYQGAKALPAESARPPQTQFMSKEPLASSSEFRDKFVAWPVERPHRHEMDKYKKPPGEIDLQTTQRLDFKHVISRPAESKKPDVKRAQTMPFVGITNYNTDFKKWQVPREPIKIREPSLHPSGKFEGESTTRLHFTRLSAPPARSCKPDGKAFMSEAPFDDHTIYRTDYIPKSMDLTERYPTPDWLKEQFDRWDKRGVGNSQSRKMSGSYTRGMTPRATPMVEVRA
ncbi:stabilizer of axonemal microtubules 1-like [Styela clava]